MPSESILDRVNVGDWDFYQRRSDVLLIPGVHGFFLGRIHRGCGSEDSFSGSVARSDTAVEWAAQYVFMGIRQYEIWIAHQHYFCVGAPK